MLDWRVIGSRAALRNNEVEGIPYRKVLVSDG